MVSDTLGVATTVQPTSPRRRTHFINRRPGSAFLHAPRIAEKIGRPLNTHVVINWWRTPLAHNEISEAFAQLRRGSFANWSRYRSAASTTPRNGPPTFVWVFEAPNQEQPHSHWCLHLQPGQEQHFAKALRRWVKRVCKLPNLPETDIVDVCTIYDMDRFKLYLMKGTTDVYAKMCNIPRVEYQGEIIGKRCGVSANINRSARLRVEGAYKRPRTATRYSAAPAALPWRSKGHRRPLPPEARE